VPATAGAWSQGPAGAVDGRCPRRLPAQEKITIKLPRFRACGVQATTRVAEGKGGRGKGCVSPSVSSAALCAATSFWRTSAAGLCTVFAASSSCCDTETIASICRESSAGWSSVAGLVSLTESVLKRFATCTSASCIKRMLDLNVQAVRSAMHEILIPRGYEDIERACDSRCYFKSSVVSGSSLFLSTSAVLRDRLLGSTRSARLFCPSICACMIQRALCCTHSTMESEFLRITAGCGRFPA